MSNAVIRAELETRLKTWADSQPSKILIAFENMPFTKPTSGMFLEAFLIPNSTFDTSVSGDRKRYIGIFQVNCWVKSGTGMKTVEQLSQSIVNLFPLLPKTGQVSIERTPRAERPLTDSSGWIIVPVVIEYRYEA